MEAKKLRVQFERRVDSPWSWVVCVSSFIVQFLILGTHNSFGSFFVALLQEFHRSEAETGKLIRNISDIFFPQTLWLANKKFIALTGYGGKTLANFSFPLFAVNFVSGKARIIETNQIFSAAFFKHPK